MRAEVLAWMQAQRMTEPGDTVVCAVSGGADSVSMLHVLLSLQDTLGIRVEAAHFNHHLRGAESDRDEAFVRQLCASLGVPLHTGGGDVQARAAQTHESLEEAARKLRYAFFDTLPGLVATAHTQDDNLETVLLNLTRGTGLAGLTGIPPKRGRLIRPMLVCTRAQIEACLAEHGFSYVTDSTNLLPDARRNRLRQRVIPLLREENPAVAQTVFRTCALLRKDDAYLDTRAREALQAAQLPNGVSRSALSVWPEAVRTRAVRLLLGSIHAPKLTQRHIDAVDRLLFASCPSASVSLPGGFAARLEYDRLYLTDRSPAASFSPVTLSPGETVLIPALGLRVECRIEENFQENAKTLSTFAVKYDTIEQTPRITIRPRQAHDVMHTAGGTKTLKKLLIDRKVPAARRALMPVAADASGVLGVYGIGVDLGRAAAPGDRAVIITIEETEKEDKMYD